MNIQKCYELFEIDKNASLDDVMKKYQFLKKKWNPEKYGENQELQTKALLKMKEVNIAYENLQHFLFMNKKVVLNSEYEANIEFKRKTEAKAKAYYQKIYEEKIRSGEKESKAKEIAKIKARSFYNKLYNKRDISKTNKTSANLRNASELKSSTKPVSDKELQSKKFIHANDFRVHYEEIMLYASIAILAFTLIILLKINLILILSLIGISIGWVKVRQGQLLGQCVKISENQLPDVYKASKTASRKLSMKLPEVFVIQDPVINAYAIGFIGKKSVVLHSATVESMTEDELISILGHEFSHIKCGHTIWTVITSSTEGFNIPVVSQVLSFIFFFWSRKAEYSCDRGGLIACSDLKSSVSALAKVAVGEKLFDKLDIANLFDQKIDIEQDDVSKISETLSTHPYIVNRIHGLKLFFESPQYEKLSTISNKQMNEEISENSKNSQSNLECFPKKERHWFLTTWLIILLLGNVASILMLFKSVSIIGAIKIILTNDNRLFQLTFIIQIINIVCVIALFRWKKIGFWGLCGSSAVIFAIGIWNGYGFNFSIRPFFAMLLLFASLNVGDKNKGWHQLE